MPGASTTWKQRVSHSEPSNRTHLIYERDKDNGLPLMLLPIEISRESTWVEIENGGIHVDHQTLSRKKKAPHVTQ